LAYEEGRSEQLLQKFYHLLIITRRRQQLPPQPLAWFRNLITSLGDQLKICVASKDSRPVASILTIQHKASLYYKYGCSDKQFSSMGGMHLLFWKAIQDAKSKGVLDFDMGRSDLDNPGLIDFKDRWGSVRSALPYWRWPAGLAGRAFGMGIARQVFAVAPDSVLTTVGRVLYRHFG
jgi:lipid II:glycine glycyltransferase (peptidoglycan interpeptide bridge formation enzyme)